MKTKKNGVKRKSRLIVKLKGKKRSKIMKGGSGSIISQTFINRITGKQNKLEIYEKTDTAIGIKLLKQPHDIFFTITPMVLSVDIMQLAVNTNNIVISRDGNFMSFKNLPSLIVDDTSYGSYGYTPTSRTLAKWYLIEETGLESKTFIRPPSQYVGTNPSISKLQGEVTNEQVFLAPMIDYYDKRLCLYRTNIIYKQNESDKGEPRELYERIVYLRDISEWLENIDNGIGNTNTKCDLFGLDNNYIIINKFRNTDDKDEYKDEYIICGYPNQETKQLILQFWQGIWKEQFNLTHDDNLELYIKLFNQKNTSDKIGNDDDLYKFYSSIRKTIFEYVKARYEELSTDITKGYNTLEYKAKLDEFNANFDKNVKVYFNEVARKYLHKFMAYINYNFFIFKKHSLGDGKYKLVPAIFNIRELTSIHKPILERINKLIRNELPRIFGISTEGNYNPIETYDIKLEYDEDKEYKLFYSHYRHGQVFHIKTEYLHSMSNVSDKAHGYKYGLTLEEIIYNCNIKKDDGITPYFQAVKFIYEVRQHQIDEYDKITKDNQKTRTFGYTGRIMTGKSLDKRIENIERKKNRSDIVYDLYEKDKVLRKKDINNVKKVIDNIQFPQDTFNISQIKFILMFLSSSQEYTFIYSFNNVFYELVIKSNISNMTDIILNKLNKKINEKHTAEFVDKTISFEKIDLPQVFRIVSNRILDKSLYSKSLVKPIILKQFSKPLVISEQNIDTFYYYSTDLLDVNKHKPIGYENFFMPNLYNSNIHIPILIQNFYKNNNNFDSNKIIYEDNKNKFNNCAKTKLSCDSPINYIWKNNYGYDFIENIDNEQDKLNVYVCPSNLFDTSIKQTHKYLNNFMYLDSSHIEMLKALQNKYSNDNYNCFVHHTLSPYFSCLHFHIIKKNLYKREYSNMEVGSFLIQDIYISELINNLTINQNYYRDYNYSLIKEH
jgi:hypothetical protein